MSSSRSLAPPHHPRLLGHQDNEPTRRPEKIHSKAQRLAKESRTTLTLLNEKAMFETDDAHHVKVRPERIIDEVPELKTSSSIKLKHKVSALLVWLKSPRCCCCCCRI